MWQEPGTGAGGEPACALGARRTWRQLPRSRGSWHAGWAGVGYAELVSRPEHKNAARELVIYLENLWKNRRHKASEPRNTEQKDFWKRGRVHAAPQPGRLWPYRVSSLAAPREETFVATDLYSVVQCPQRPHLPLVCKQFVYIWLNYIPLTRI